MALIDYSALVFTVKGLYEEDGQDNIIFTGCEITVSNSVFTVGEFSFNPIDLEDTLPQLEDVIKKGKGTISFSSDFSCEFWIKYSDTTITFGTSYDAGSCSFRFPVNESSKQMLVSLHKILEEHA